MRLHHIGIAVKSIPKQMGDYQRLLGVGHIGSVVYDPIQDAHLCMAELGDGTRLEFVEGKPVEKYLARGVQVYHLCYEVGNLEEEMTRISQNGGVVVSGPEPAVLFGGRRVAFLYTRAGLIELLEE